MAEISDSGFGVDSITVKDESIASVSSSTKLSLLSVVAPVFSSDGLDNKLSEETSYTDVTTKYGSDFADKSAYGQQNLNVQQALKAGGKVYLCRLLPENAKFSSLVLKVGVKSDESIPLYERDTYGTFLTDDDGKKIQKTVKDTEGNDVPVVTSGLKFKIYVTHPSEDEWKTTSSIKRMSGIQKAVSSDADEGYVIFPLAFFSYYARGKCGNDYGLEIGNDLERDESVSDGRRYLLNLIKKTSTGVSTMSIGSDISFAFNPNALVSSNIPSIEGLQNMYQNYDSAQKAKQVQLSYYTDNWAKFQAEVTSLLSQERAVTEGFDSANYEFVSASSALNIDFINGISIDGNKYDDIIIDEASIDLDDPQYFEGGTDGDFDTLTGDALASCKDDLLAKFYDGDIDTENFLDVLRCDAGIQFDADYSLATKIQMAKTINYRPDIVTVWDCGDTDDIYGAIAVAKALSNVVSNNGENFAIVPHFGTTTNRSVDERVSATYEFAYGLISLYNRSPFAIYSAKPNDNGCVKTMIFDWLVTETKPKGHFEKLAKLNRLYYAIDLGKAVSTLASGNTTGRNVYFYANSNLYSEKLSKLSEFRNGLLVNDLKRICKLVLVKYTFDTDGADAAMSKAREELVTIFSTRYPTNIMITLDLFQTDRDTKLNMASCAITVTFPDVFETWSCTITTKRNSSD